MRTKKLACFAAAIFCLVAAQPASAGRPDPLAPLQWGLRKVKAPKAWSISKGEGVVIAIIDTGVDLGHPDLAPNIVSGSGAGDIVGGDADPQDENGHGTHVAGIAAGIARNGKGIAGVAPKAKILPVRVLDADGSGSASDVAAGIRYAIRSGADVINLSMEVEGGGIVGGLLGDGSDEVRAAIDEAVGKGIVVVVAAGNTSSSSCNAAVANNNVLCVGSVDVNNQLSPFSNYDQDEQNTYLVAPGGDGASCETDIYSTVLRTIQPSCSTKRGYESFSGTSMASPHVAGIAAMLVSKGLTEAQVIQCFKTTSTDLGAPGRDGTFGYGLVNAFKAVSTC